MSKRVLVVEDDEAMTVALRDGFASEGYEVHTVADGLSGLEALHSTAPDLVILDVMLPRLNGLDLCRRLRSEGNTVPIIMLTARGQEVDKVLGLKMGADDYVTKPFSIMELLARAEAVLRRGPLASEEEAPRTYRFGDVDVDFQRHEARKAGEVITMSPREFQLLEYLIGHRGQVVGRDELLDAVWGYRVMPLTRTVDTHVAKLRKKIEDQPSEPRFLVTVHRVGYKFLG